MSHAPQPKTTPWQERAAKLFCALVALLALWWLFRHAAAVVGVVLVAWAVAAVIDPLARKTAAVTHLPRKLWVVLYLLLGLLTLGFLLTLAVRRLTEELEELFLWLGNNTDLIEAQVGKVTDLLDSLRARIPLLGESAAETPLYDSVQTMLGNTVSEALSGLAGGLTAALGRLLRGAPRALITLVVGVMACLYLSLDYEGTRDRLLALLPPGAQKKAARLRARGRVAIRSYVRAYLVLFLLTFLEVFVGLLLLRVRYALLVALLVATVDLLPVLGAGAVLIPWAVVLFVLGTPSVGIGLLILYGVMTIVRQILEPHLLGGTLGIPPLLSLLSMFLGLHLFGILGMLLAPAATVLLKELLAPHEEGDTE